MSTRPTPSPTATWLWPLLAMAGMAITIVPRLRWVNIYEDQAVLAGQAMQVAAGQVPYRDFFAAIPPGAIFLYAGLFKLFGATVVNERLLTGVAMVLGVGLVARIGSRVVGAVWAAAIALLWGVWLPVFQEFSPYHFWSVTFILAMTTALLAARDRRPEGRPRDLEIQVVRAEGRGGPTRNAVPAGSPRRGRGGSDDGPAALTHGSGRMGSKDPAGISGRVSNTSSVRWFVLAGLAASAALIMLQSSLPAVMAGFFAAWLIERRTNRSVRPMFVAMAIPGVLVLAVLGLLGALPAFITDTVLYTFQTFGASQAIPFPWQPALLHDTSFWEASLGALWAIPMHWLLAVIAPIAVGVYTAVTLVRRRHQLAAIPDWALLGVVAVGLYSSVLIVHMSDQNFWLSSCLTLLLVAMPLRRTLAGMSSSPIIARAAAIPLAVIYLTGLSPLVLGYALTCHMDGTGFLQEVSAPGGSICTTFDSAPIVAGAVQFTSQHHEAVAFMPTGPSLYQITGRVPPVPVLFLVPGVTPPAEMGGLERTMRILPVRWVIYYKVDFSKDLPAVRELHDGSPSQFDQFLADSYQRDDQDGLIVFKLRS